MWSKLTEKAGRKNLRGKLRPGLGEPGLLGGLSDRFGIAVDEGVDSRADLLRDEPASPQTYPQGWGRLAGPQRGEILDDTCRPQSPAGYECYARDEKHCLGSGQRPIATHGAPQLLDLHNKAAPQSLTNG